MRAQAIQIDASIRAAAANSHSLHTKWKRQVSNSHSIGVDRTKILNLNWIHWIQAHTHTRCIVCTHKYVTFSESFAVLRRVDVDGKTNTPSRVCAINLEKRQTVDNKIFATSEHTAAKVAGKTKNIHVIYDVTNL